MQMNIQTSGLRTHVRGKELLLQLKFGSIVVSLVKKLWRCLLLKLYKSQDVRRKMQKDCELNQTNQSSFLLRRLRIIEANSASHMKPTLLSVTEVLLSTSFSVITVEFNWKEKLVTSDEPGSSSKARLNPEVSRLLYRAVTLGTLQLENKGSQTAICKLCGGSVGLIQLQVKLHTTERLHTNSISSRLFC